MCRPYVWQPGSGHDVCSCIKLECNKADATQRIVLCVMVLIIERFAKWTYASRRGAGAATGTTSSVEDPDVTDSSKASLAFLFSSLFFSFLLAFSSFSSTTSSSSSSFSASTASSLPAPAVFNRSNSPSNSFACFHAIASGPSGRPAPIPSWSSFCATAMCETRPSPATPSPVEGVQPCFAR